MVTTADAETRAVTPQGLQSRIDEAVRAAPSGANTLQTPFLPLIGLLTRMYDALSSGPPMQRPVL